MNGFSRQKWFIFYFSPIGIRPSTPTLGAFAVAPVCLRSAFALASLPEADKKRSQKGSTAKQPRPPNPPISRRPTVTRYSVTVRI